MRRTITIMVAALLAIILLAVCIGLYLRSTEGPSPRPEATPIPLPTMTTVPKPEYFTTEPTEEPAAVGLRTDSVEALYRALRETVNAGLSTVTLTGTAATQAAITAAADSFPSVRRWSCSITEDQLELRMEYHTGARIVNALRRGELLELADAELYAAAQALLSELLTEDMGPLEREQAIYRYICGHCSYAIDETRHTESAEGFLRYGAAQCSGYADALYLLGSMAGLELYCMSGTAQATGETHEWVLIRLDGLWYYVDPTWGDADDCEVLEWSMLDLPVDMARSFLSWDERVLPEGEYASLPDEKNPAAAAGCFTQDPERALELVRAHLAEGGSAMLLFGGRLDVDALVQRLGTDVSYRKAGVEGDGYTAVYFTRIG